MTRAERIDKRSLAKYAVAFDTADYYRVGDIALKSSHTFLKQRAAMKNASRRIGFYNKLYLEQGKVVRVEKIELKPLRFIVKELV